MRVDDDTVRDVWRYRPRDVRGVQRPRDAPVRRILAKKQRRGQFRQSCRDELDGAETNERMAPLRSDRETHRRREEDSIRHARGDVRPRTNGRSSTEGIEKQSVMGGWMATERRHRMGRWGERYIRGFDRETETVAKGV